jgi:capsular polysaccharide biosynthesis protein
MRVHLESTRAKQFAGRKYSSALQDFLLILRRNLWLIAIVVVCTAGTVTGLILMVTPQYEASTKILVGQGSETVTPGGLQNDVLGLQTLTQTIVETIKSRSVAEAVIQQLDLPISSEEFLTHLTAEQIRATQYIEVRYEDPNPVRAQQVANTIGEVVSQQVSEVSSSAYDVTATVWDFAELPDQPVRPNLVLVISAALVVGLMLGVALACLREYLSDSWNSPK